MRDYREIARELNRRILENPSERLRIIQDFYTEMLDAGDGEGADYVLTLRSITMAASNNQHPKWLQPASIAIGVLTLIFFMVIVVLGIIGYPVPPSTKFALVAVLALGAAFAAATWIGNMVLSGDIASPNGQKPLVVSATGGFATFIIVFALGYWLYIK